MKNQLIKSYLSKVKSANKELPKKEAFKDLLNRLYNGDPEIEKIIDKISLGAETTVLDIPRKDKLHRGSADTLYNKIIIEFENDLKVTLNHAKEQLAGYLLGKFNEGEGYNFTLIASDCITWKIFSPDLNNIDKIGELTEDELLIILANTPYSYLKDIFTVAFYTGMRLGELINMKWNWVDFFKNQITVKCSDEFTTKSKKERIVPMCEKVKTILSNRYHDSKHQMNEVVFYRQKGRMLHQETISKQFKDVVRKSNLNERIHFHTLRHSFASLLVQRGVSLYVVKELLGHEDLATTQIYSHLQQQNLKDAVYLL